MQSYWVGAAALVCVLAVGCSQPDQAVVPSDPAKYDEIKSSVEKLPPQDREALMRYMVRARVGATRGDAQTIPLGITIRQAIDAQRALEAELAAKDAAAKALKAKLELERAERRKALESAVNVVLVGFLYVPKDIYASRYDDKVNVEFAFENKTNREIAGVQGETAFRDIFGNEVRRVNLRYDQGIGIGKTVTWKGSVKVNQFSDTDQRFAQLDPNSVKFSFEPDMIVFRDGTSLRLEP